jgi:hypothetical protein
MASFEIDIDPRLEVKSRTVPGSSLPLPQPVLRNTNPAAATTAAYAARNPPQQQVAPVQQKDTSFYATICGTKIGNASTQIEFDEALNSVECQSLSQQFRTNVRSRRTTLPKGCDEINIKKNTIEKKYNNLEQLKSSGNQYDIQQVTSFETLLKRHGCPSKYGYPQQQRLASTPQNLPGAFGAVETIFRQGGGRRRSKKSSKKHLKRSSKKHSKKHSKKSSKKHLKRSSKKHSKKHSKKSSKKHGKKY